MYQAKNIKGTLLISVLILFAFLLVLNVALADSDTSIVQGNLGECQIDPFPFEMSSVSVPCDDPNCNVGPCVNKTQTEPETTKVETRELEPEKKAAPDDSTIQDNLGECQNDPFPLEAQNIPVPCDDPTCNVGPCVNKSQTEPEATKVETRNLDPEKKEEIVVKQKERGSSETLPVITISVSDPSKVTNAEDLKEFAQSLLEGDPDIKLIKLSSSAIELSYTYSGKLFGIIPIRPLTKVYLDDSRRVKVKYPWYDIFVKKAVVVVEEDFSEVEFKKENTLAERAKALHNISKIMKARHDTTKSSINNIR